MSSKKELSQISASEAGRIGVTSLATRPNDASRYGQGGLSAKELQAWFDKLPNLVRERFNEIAKALASSEAAKYIGLDGSVGGTDNLYDFLSLFGARGSGVGDKNIGDYIETLYHSEDEANDKSYTLKDIIADVLARFALCEERRQAINDKLTVSAEYGAEDYVLSLFHKDGTVVEVSVEALADELYEAIREAKDELERVIADVDGKLPVIRAEDEGKYLQIVNGKVAFSEQPYISPKLFPPMISSVTEWGKISVSNNSMNGGYKVAFKIYVNGNHVDTTMTTDSAESYFNRYVDGKYTGVVGVSAVADRFLESEVTNRDYALTTGTYGLSYSVNGSSAVCTGIGSAFAQDIEIGTYYRGIPVREIAASAFEGADISSVKIPESIETIRDCAFQDCASLVSVEFAENGKNVHFIGNKAFNRCTNLATFKIPTGLNALKFGTLVGNDVITSLTIPANIEYMYNQCIYALSALQTVRFDGGPTGTNGAANFSKCPNLTDIYVPWNYIENGYFGAPWGAENATVHYSTPPIIDPQTI